MEEEVGRLYNFSTVKSIIVVVCWPNPAACLLFSSLDLISKEKMKRKSTDNNLEAAFNLADNIFFNLSGIRDLEENSGDFFFLQS